MENVASYPLANTLEEVTFNLGALGSRNGVVLDLKDWSGAELAEFSDTRKSGFPLLDLVVLPPAALNVIVEHGIDAVTFTPALTLGVPGGTWGELAGVRLPARFARIVVTDTSGGPNNGVYLWYRVASQ